MLGAGSAVSGDDGVYVTEVPSGATGRGRRCAESTLRRGKRVHLSEFGNLFRFVLFVFVSVRKVICLVS